MAKSRTQEARLVERAGMVLMCLGGQPIVQIAKKYGTRSNTVIEWRNRFARDGVKGLRDLPRSGKPPTYGVEFRNRVLAALEQPPPAGQARWDGQALATKLGSSADALWRMLRKEGICLQRQRSWCVSTDPEFAPEAEILLWRFI